MLFCIRLRSFVVLDGRPGPAPAAEVVGPTLLFALASPGENESQIREELGFGVQLEVGDGDGGRRARGVWKGPAYVEIEKVRHLARMVQRTPTSGSCPGTGSARPRGGSPVMRELTEKL